MVISWFTIGARLATSATANKKADVAEHLEEFHHVGLLFNESPGNDRVTLYLVVRQLCSSGVILCRRFEKYNDQNYAPRPFNVLRTRILAGKTVISHTNV
jgi:hypothetical protein